MTRIVTYAHRPKRPPRKQQAAPLAGSAVVTTKSSRRPRLAETAAEAASPEEGDEAAPSVARPAANDDRKPAPTKPAIVATANRKLTKLRRAERAADDGTETPPEVKAFLPMRPAPFSTTQARDRIIAGWKRGRRAHPTRRYPYRLP
jgi:hypothetical protein